MLSSAALSEASLPRREPAGRQCSWPLSGTDRPERIERWPGMSEVKLMTTDRDSPERSDRSPACMSAGILDCIERSWLAG